MLEEIIVNNRWAFSPKRDSLGKGKTGEVYKARHINMGTEVALKIVTEKDKVDRLSNEVTIESGLEHPRMIKLTDFFEENEKYYLISNLVKGKNIEEFIKSGNISVQTFGAIAEQLAEVVAYLHTNNKIHRDIHSRNVLLDNLLNVYLTDFETAKLADFARPRRKTGSGSCSPSDVKEDSNTTQFDVACVGDVLQALISAVRVNKQDQREKSLYTKFIDIINKAAAPIPGSRYVNAAELLSEIKNALDKGLSDDEKQARELYSTSKEIIIDYNNPDESKFNEKIKLCEEAFLLNPKDEQIKQELLAQYFEKIKVLYSKDLIDDSICLAYTVIGVSAKNANARQWLGAAYFKKFKRKHEVQHIEKAIAELENAKKLDPKNYWTRHLLGTYYSYEAKGTNKSTTPATNYSVKAKNLNRALKECRLASALNPVDKNVLEQLANVLMQKKKYADAKKAYEKLCGTGRKDLISRLDFAEAELRKKKKINIIGAAGISIIITLSAAAMGISYKLNPGLRSGVNEFFHSVKKITAVMTQKPSDKSILLSSADISDNLDMDEQFILAKSCIETKRYKDAEIRLTKLIRRKSKYISDYEERGRYEAGGEEAKEYSSFHNSYLVIALTRQGPEKYNEAEKAASEAIRLYSKNVHVYIALAELRKAQEQLPAAKELLIKAINMNNNNYDAHYELGLLYKEAEEYKNALQEFKTAKQLTQSFKDKLYYKSLEEITDVSYTLKDYTTALVCSNELLDAGIENDNIYKIRGLVFFSQEKYVYAAESFEKAADLSPHAIHYYNAGLSYYSSDEYKEATLAFKKSLKLDPNYKGAKEMLDKIQRETRHKK